MGNSIWTKVSIVLELIQANSRQPSEAVSLSPSPWPFCCSAAQGQNSAWSVGHSWRSLYMAEPTSPMLHPFHFSGCVMAQALGELLDKRTIGQWPSSQWAFVCPLLWAPISPNKDSHPSDKMTEVWNRRTAFVGSSSVHQIHCLRASSSGILAAGSSGRETR